jgi:hypothetical protein
MDEKRLILFENKLPRKTSGSKKKGIQGLDMKATQDIGTQSMLPKYTVNF